MEKKQDIKAFFTCPICNNLYDRATSISECLHTFCRRCIEDKFIVENLKACPVCNVDLGVAPLDKLRPDNTWADLRLSVFKPNVKAATETDSISLKYSRKKNKSLLTSPDAPLETEKLGEQIEAVSLNQISSRPVPNFRRRPRKNAMPKRNDTQLELHTESGNGFNIEQDYSLVGASTYNGCTQKENKLENDNEEITMSSDGLGKSLTTDKEVVQQNQDYVAGECAEETQNNVLNPSEEVLGETNKKPVLVIFDGDTEEVSGKKGKGKAYSPPVLRPRRQGNMNSTEAENKVEGSNMQVWLSLIAASNQNTDRPLLPQISRHYIRTNGDLPVSYVNKYLANKLGLESEDEVEIWLREEPVCLTQKLHDLVDWWVQTTPIAERKSAMVGNSGAEFVMVLHYSASLNNSSH